MYINVSLKLAYRHILVHVYPGISLCTSVILICTSFSILIICSLQVETILDKDNFTLEELLDEDEIIQECKALNGRLINL